MKTNSQANGFENQGHDRTQSNFDLASMQNILANLERFDNPNPAHKAINNALLGKQNLISAKQALKQTLDNDEALRTSPEARVYNLKNERFVYQSDSQTKLFHRISYTVESENGPTSPVHYIDAQTGKQLS